MYLICKGTMQRDFLNRAPVGKSKSYNQENANITLDRKWARKYFSLVRKSPICKFLGSFRCRKSASFLGMPVRKSQIRKCFGLISKLQIHNFVF